ncbi:hypothetical protein Gasu2_61380 [Galdieria sulphuraria]|uniref:CBU-0592-like domain-containing protein n=1 Tax=Galdieria sulphuraria TaxID=130081 RepID=M2X0U4_GALSU|nr:uncharacterized protein Gasu_27530 [Galdieria sulphuraria]EME29970.1 hypothetical protein Gasu_27530 [Galdieria sulphuraria]GJD12025.1 hypothetical protein Gasu2_61380 [Galdieria sulphuraria]|eukprot:XP_005706490.1 hypothetical protein Gasu_27530 [Galdieria sulphuraria]
MSTENLLNVVFGVLGSVAMLVLFVLNTLHYLEEDCSTYLLVNALGALFACLAAVFVKYWPFIALEASWTLFSLIRFGIKIMKPRK